MTDPTAGGLDCVEVVVTADTSWVADYTRHLVKDRIGAYGDNIAPMRAIFRWDGQIHDDLQACVGLRTQASLVSEIVARAYRDHDVPATSHPIAAGHLTYLRHMYKGMREPR